MRTDAHSVTDVALALEPAERLALAATLIDSVEEPVDPAWAAAWTEELRARSANADARTVRGSTWQDVRARVLRDLASR